MIIESLLDTDLYKFTMMQVVLHHFPGAQVEYRFKCRNPGLDLTPYLDEIRDEIRALCALRFRPHELSYLRGWRFFKSGSIKSSMVVHSENSTTLRPSNRALVSMVSTPSRMRSANGAASRHSGRCHAQQGAGLFSHELG
jgi:hypothetical protein